MVGVSEAWHDPSRLPQKELFTLTPVDCGCCSQPHTLHSSSDEDRLYRIVSCHTNSIPGIPIHYTGTSFCLVRFRTPTLPLQLLLLTHCCCLRMADDGGFYWCFRVSCSRVGGVGFTGDWLGRRDGVCRAGNGWLGGEGCLNGGNVLYARLVGWCDR